VTGDPSESATRQSKAYCYEWSVRVLQVITDTDRRGAQVFAVDLGEALTSRGCSVTTIALQSGTTAARLAVASLGRHGRSPLTLMRLRREMGNADVTVAHGSSTLLACAVAGLGVQRPWVYRQISDPLFWAGSRSRRFRVRRFLGRAAAVTALSKDIADVLVHQFGVSRSRLTVIPNGVSGRRFAPATGDSRRAARLDLGIEPDQFVALYVGALAAEKGVSVGIEALASCPNALLVIAGDGPQRDELRALADRWAPHRVRFVGSVSDIVPLYHAAEVVVFPSVGGDSMPAALIESGLCGLPAICTPVGAATDVVIDRVTGSVVAMNDVAALSAALRLLMSDATLRGQLGAAAFTHCRTNFEIDSIADRWFAVLEQFAGRNGSKTA
jgi:glycosyltransferase involved in cell wall biosynthesis